MKNPSNKSLFFIVGALCVNMACTDDGTPLAVPDTYTFTRDGVSTVSYDGQIDRLDQLSEIKTYLRTGDAGEELDAGVLQDMYENTDGDGGGAFSFTSDRQLKDKTFAADVSFFEDLFESAEIASQYGLEAGNGLAGLLTRSSGNTILVDINGHEFTQGFEKGMMGSVLLNQIMNVYLTDSRIGDGVENTLVDGENNYTAMEHHWDEAFGYFGVPVDFPTTTTARFWGAYSNNRDALLGTNSLLMDAFRTGRAAIVADRHAIKEHQRDIIYEGFELIAAASAVHYLNAVKEALVAEETGDAFHQLTEGYMFIKALRMSPRKQITEAQITLILDTYIGENFWALTDTDLSGLDDAVDLLVSVYPDLESVQSSL